MAVIVTTGATRSGKSRMVEHSIIPRYKKVLVFDVMNCFRKMHYRISMDERFGLRNTALDKAFHLAMLNPESFKISLVPEANTDDRKALEALIETAFMLGRAFGSEEEPLLLVVDEAGGLCSSSFLSARIKKLVTKGRHFHVDSLFIAQRPQMLHGDILGNCASGELNCFQQLDAGKTEILVKLLGKDYASRIADLPPYHYLTRKSTGEVYFTDENGTIYGRK